MQHLVSSLPSFVAPCYLLHNFCTTDQCTLRCFRAAAMVRALPVQHLQAAFTANAELPRSLPPLPCAHCAAQFVHREPAVAVRGNTAACFGRVTERTFTPRALFLKPTMGLASLPLSFGELRCRIFSRVRSCAGLMHSFKASARTALSLWQIVLVHLTPTSGSSRPADNI